MMDIRCIDVSMGVKSDSHMTVMQYRIREDT